MSQVAGRPQREVLGPRVWKIAGVAALGPLLTNIDSTVVNVSLSTLGRDLHVSLATVQWVVTAYLLALALMLPVSGWLVDRMGARRVYLLCFSLFTAASLGCGAARTAATLIPARILQGMAGGLLAPMAQMMVAREAPTQIARVMGIMVIPILLGPIFGPSLAGLILQHATWHWLFFINLPLGVLALALAARILPKDGGEAVPRRFDWAGFGMLSPGLVMLLYSLERFGATGRVQRSSLTALCAALALLVTYLQWARRRGTAALVDLQLFRDRTFRASSMTQFMANAVLFGSQVLMPLFLLGALQRSGAQTGLILACSGLGGLLSFPWAGTLTERFGPRRLSATGLAISFSFTLPFALLPAAALHVPLVCALLFARGIGQGMISIPSVSAAYASLAREQVPVATTALNIVQRLGGPFATTLLVLFLHARGVVLGHGGAVPYAAYAETFALLCALHAVALLPASRLPLRAAVRAGR